MISDTFIYKKHIRVFYYFYSIDEANDNKSLYFTAFYDVRDGLGALERQEWKIRNFQPILLKFGFAPSFWPTRCWLKGRYTVTIFLLHKLFLLTVAYLVEIPQFSTDFAKIWFGPLILAY